MKLMFASDDPLDVRYVREGLGSLRVLPEQVRIQNWENVAVAANGFAALVSSPPGRIRLPLVEKQARESTGSAEVIELGAPRSTAPASSARRMSAPGADPSPPRYDR